MPPMPKPAPRQLSRSDLPSDTADLARYLIGKTLIHDAPEGRVSGRIVETEAYVVGDAASHAYRGITPRNRSMFLHPGHAYVYFIYGSWYCLNVSGGPEGVGAAVLIRALEPLEGMELMQARRPGARPHRMAAGPGCLAAAFGVDPRFDGMDLCGGSPLLLAGPVRRTPAASIGASARIGVTRDADRLLRFFERGNPSVSGPRRLLA
jgi:DNA-3-methyladenine glycosylase